MSPETSINPNLSILRLQQVKAITGLSQSSIYALMTEGEFPANVQLSKRRVGWISSEINEWIEQRITASRNY